MSVSAETTAAVRVRVTVAPLIDGEPLRPTACSLPPEAVFFTVKALFARLAAAARSSLKVMTSAVPLTVALWNVGGVVSAEEVRK